MATVFEEKEVTLFDQTTGNMLFSGLFVEKLHTYVALDTLQATRARV